MKRLLTLVFRDKRKTENFVNRFTCAMQHTPLHCIFDSLAALIKREKVTDPTDDEDDVYIVDLVAYKDEHTQVAWSSYTEGSSRFISLHFKTFGYDMAGANGEASIQLEIPNDDIEWVVEGALGLDVWEV